MEGLADGRSIAPLKSDTLLKRLAVPAVAVGLLGCAPLASAATYHVAPGGSDSNPGTEERPWESLDRALSILDPGDTAYVHAGTYGARGTDTVAARSGTASAPITIQAAPEEERPTVLGAFKITGSHLRFSRLSFDGPTGQVKTPTADNPKGEDVQVWVKGGDDVAIDRSIVRDSWWHAGIFLSDDAEDARITNNCVVNNGDRDPAVIEKQLNKSHGIYWGSGSGVVAGNFIDSNLARGVQLYTRPHDVTITGNTIVNNGRAGILFAEQTRDTLAADNVVAFNGDTGIRSLDLSGTGNVARGNVGFGNVRGDFGDSEPGLSFERNVVSDPTADVDVARARLCAEAVPAEAPDTQAPTVPDGLAAAATGSASVALEWNAAHDDAGVVAYTVYRDGQEVGTTAATGYTDNTAQPGTTHSYAVDAVDAAGNRSGRSEPATASTEPLAGSPAIEFRGASFAANPTSLMLTLTAPTRAAPGDTMVAVVEARGNTRITAPPGWTLVRHDGNGAAMVAGVYTHRVGGAESSSYTWRLSASRAAAGGILAYSGVDSVTPVDVHGGRVGERSRNVEAPSIVTGAPDARVIGLFGVATAASIAPPQGMTERGETSSTAGRYDLTVSASDMPWPLAAPTGTRSAVSDRVARNVGQLVALRAR